MEVAAIIAIIKEVGALIAFLWVILLVGQRLIESLVTNITNEMRNGFQGMYERMDTIINGRGVDTQVILSALSQHTDVIVSHIVDRPICPLAREKDK